MEEGVGRIGDEIIVEGDAVFWVNNQAPGKTGGRAVEFLVDEVTPAANGLAQGQPRRTVVEPLQRVQLGAPGVDHYSQHAPNKGSVDA